MVAKPYRISRQQHLGEMLDELERRGRLRWRWDYDEPAHRAIFWVGTNDEDELIAYDTKHAEAIAQSHCDHLGIRWKPVPHPGGDKQLLETLAWINEE